VIFRCVSVAGSGYDADADATGEKVEEAGDDGRRGCIWGVRDGEAGAIVVEGDVAIKGKKLEGRGGGGERDELGGVEDETNVVEGGGDETPRGYVAEFVLIVECGDEGEGSEEGGDRRDEH